MYHIGAESSDGGVQRRALVKKRAVEDFVVEWIVVTEKINQSLNIYYKEKLFAK